MIFSMRPSRVLRKIREGKVASCTKLNLSDVRAVEIAALSGVDCIWLDLEHVPNSMACIENAVYAAKAYDCDILTRVSRGGYSDYTRPLEADSTGIMVPHLMSLKDAEYVQYYTKFHPIGRRPVDGGNADGKFCLIPFEDYLAQANSERFVVCQIEDPEPLKDLEEICQLPGIDMIFFGPGDFSQGVGRPGDTENPEQLAVRRLVAKTARKYGKAAGTVGSVANYDTLVKEGYNFISVGADVVALTNYFLDIGKATADWEATKFEDIK